MKPSTSIFLVFALVIGAIWLTYEHMKPVEYAGVSCAANRVVAFGSTDRRIPIAEMAAIARWQADAEKKNPGFGNWHIARDRDMNCKKFQDSAHFQCTVSASPCKYENPGKG